MNNKYLNNKENDILLSINLLTYNQPNEAREALKSILPQITNEVEIIVNDNSDNFNTKNLIENEFSNFNIKYFKNEGERTINANVLNAINRSQGEYVWLFGDDKIERGAINAILKIIKSNKYNFIFTNFYINEQGIKNPVVKLESDEILNDGNFVLEKVANCLGFLSSNIIRKECLLSIDMDKLNKFMGFGYVNFYVVIHALSLPGLSYLCSYPYVRANAVLAENMTEKYKYDAFKNFAADTFEILNSFKSKFNQKSVKKLLSKNFGHIWRGMLVGIVNNRDIQKGHIKMIFRYYWNFPEFWIALPFFLMPQFVNVFFYKLYKKLTGKSEFIKKRISKVPWF